MTVPALAAKTGASTVKPAVQSAKKVSGGVRLGLRVTFASSHGCPGLVTLSTKGANGTIVTLRGTSLSLVDRCVVLLAGIVPAADYGHVVPFTFTFVRVQAGFRTTLRITVAPPKPKKGKPVTPGPLKVGAPKEANGSWTGHLDAPYFNNIALAVADGEITSAYLLSTAPFMTCTPQGGGTPSPTFFAWHYPHPSPISVNAQGEFSGTERQQRTLAGGNTSDLTYTIHGQFNTTAKPYTGTFTLGVSGTFVLQGEASACSGTAGGVLFKQ